MKTKNKIIIAVIAAVLLIGGLIIFLMMINSNDTDKVGATIYDTDAFFIRESSDTDSKYALFKNNGNRLTGFDFVYAGTFIDGYAVVRNDDEQYGIIDHNGKMAIELGQYAYINELSGLYEVKASNGAMKIITGSGKEVAEGYKSYQRNYDTPYVAIQTEGAKYVLYNVYGDSILEFESANAPSFDTYSKEKASLISYDGHFALLNNRTLSVAFKRDADASYELKDVSVDGKTYLLARTRDGKRTMAYINNGNYYDLDNKCVTITLDDDENNPDREYLSCKNDNGTFLIRDNAISNIAVGGYTNHYVIYNANHYGYYDGKNNLFKIFVDGKEKTTVNAGYSPEITNSGYTIRDYKNKNISIYGIDGNVAYKLDGVSYGDLYGVDANGKIIVRDPRASNSDGQYYLVDKDGNIVSGKYSSISSHGEYYSALRNNEKQAFILNRDGEIIIGGEYNSFEYYVNNTVIFGRKENHFDLIDIDGESVKASFDGNVSVDKNGYFSVINGNKTEFYTFNGKLMHTQE